MTRLLMIWKRIAAVLVGESASQPLGQEWSKNHVDGQRLVVVDRDRNRIFADNARHLRSRRKSTRVLLNCSRWLEERCSARAHGEGRYAGAARRPIKSARVLR